MFNFCGDQRLFSSPYGIHDDGSNCRKSQGLPLQPDLDTLEVFTIISMPTVSVNHLALQFEV